MYPPLELPIPTLAIYRQFVSRRIGLIASRGWAQHIITRFRDTVSADPTQSPVTDAEFFAEADFSSNSRRGGYHGRSVPGAQAPVFYLVV